MEFQPLCLINCFLAILALAIYFFGSYKLYRFQKGYKLLLGIAIAIDIFTAVFASLGITPTAQLENSVIVPWDSILFKMHVSFSMIGFGGFILLYIFLLFTHSSKIPLFIRKWQFLGLLPIWIIGETIALVNSILKITFGIRLFDII